MKGDDLYKEREHIKFWDDCLNDLKKQFEIMQNLLDLTRQIKVRRMTELGNILSKYKTEINPYYKEPSHLFTLTEIFFNFLPLLWEVINKSNDELYKKINSMNIDIIKDLDLKKINLYKNNNSILDECQTLINEIKIQENEFNKKKELMDEAKKNRNKIKNQVQNIYNVGENKKADLLLAKSIKKMEEIKIPMEENKKKLREYKATLASSFSYVFENYFATYFKNLAILYQYFYLLENNKMNILLNMKKQFKDILLKISNLNFELNDYTEKKFGEVINIKYDGLILLDSDSQELINNANTSFLLKISTDILNYVKVFLICLKYRKKIMKHFYKTLNSIYKLELNIKSESQSSYDTIISQLKLIKYTSEGTFKRWNHFVNDLKSDKESKNNELLTTWVEEYINFVSNEINEFDLNWKEYKGKIKEQQNIIKDTIKELSDNREMKKNNNVINKNKENLGFKEIIKGAIKFIKENINNIRSKDKSKMQYLKEMFEKIIISYKTTINKIIDITEVNISGLINLDIFEESKVIIIKYFKNVKIRNYIGFIEKMKNKFLSQFKIENDKESNNENKEIKTESKDNNILSDEKTINSEDFENSQSQIFQDEEKVEKSEIKNMNLLFKDSRKFLFESEQDELAVNSNEKKEGYYNNIVKLNNPNEKNDNKMNDNISLDLLNRNKFYELIKIENPYKDIKEDELKKLKEIQNLKNEDQFEKDENILDNFNCALKDKILLQGKFFITNKRIWFKSLFNANTLFGKTIIMIPLKDIISIEKQSYLALDNSIVVETEKVSYFFTNYLSRDNCFDLLQEELNKVKKTNPKSGKSTNSRLSFKEIKKDNSPSPSNIKNKNSDIKIRNITQYFSKCLKNFNFSQKLNLITKERLNIIKKKYRNEKNLTFLSEKKYFSSKIFEHIFNSSPLYIFFKYICKASTQLDELGYSKGFFESILIQNFSKDVLLIEKEGDENDIESWKIPNYFINGDYVLDLFSSYDKEKFENLLNETQNWINKYEYNCYGMNKKIKKNSKSDLYTAYFVSPTLLIFDIIYYSASDNFLNNYIPIFRYKFNSDIKFNENTGKFDISTKLTVLLDVIFSINSILSNEEKNKIINEYKEKFKEFYLSKLIDVVNNYSGIFRDIYEKISMENINKKFKNFENITNLNKSLENNDITNDSDELEKYKIEDIKTIQSIEINNININNENNFIKNLNLSNNSNNIGKMNLNKNELNTENNLNNEKANDIINNENKSIINDIKSKIKKNEINIVLIIIIVLILIMFFLSFLKFEKMIINIINLICLGLSLFLFIKKL